MVCSRLSAAFLLPAVTSGRCFLSASLSVSCRLLKPSIGVNSAHGTHSPVDGNRMSYLTQWYQRSRTPASRRVSQSIAPALHAPPCYLCLPGGIVWPDSIILVEAIGTENTARSHPDPSAGCGAGNATRPSILQCAKLSCSLVS